MGPQEVGDAGETEVRSSYRDSPDVLRAGRGIEDLHVQPVLGEQTVRRCRQERQVVAGQSARAVEAEAQRVALRDHAFHLLASRFVRQPHSQSADSCARWAARMRK